MFFLNILDLLLIIDCNMQLNFVIIFNNYSINFSNFFVRICILNMYFKIPSNYIYIESCYDS